MLDEGKLDRLRIWASTVTAHIWQWHCQKYFPIPIGNLHIPFHCDTCQKLVWVSLMMHHVSSDCLRCVVIILLKKVNRFCHLPPHFPEDCIVSLFFVAGVVISSSAS